jgi:hypothetical protein
MVIDLSRLVFGLTLLLFHRRIAEFMLHHERVLVVLFRQRGLRLPDLTTQAAQNLYFSLGFFVCVLQMYRVWKLLPAR